MRVAGLCEVDRSRTDEADHNNEGDKTMSIKQIIETAKSASDEYVRTFSWQQAVDEAKCWSKAHADLRPRGAVAAGSAARSGRRAPAGGSSLDLEWTRAHTGVPPRPPPAGSGADPLRGRG